MRARQVRGRSRRLRVVVTDAKGRPVSAAGLARWIERAAPRQARGQVSVALVGDAVSRRLNREHRGKDAATDVLSFPAGPSILPHPGIAGPHLGDLAIAIGVARRQAREHAHAVDVELRILALHGLLHLLGYDHDVDRGEMARVEARLGRRAGLPRALIGRTGSGRW